MFYVVLFPEEELIFRGPRWRTEPSDLILPINSPDQEAIIRCDADGSPTPQYRYSATATQLQQCCKHPSEFLWESCREPRRITITLINIGLRGGPHFTHNAEDILYWRCRHRNYMYVNIKKRKINVQFRGWLKAEGCSMMKRHVMFYHCIISCCTN